jgi:hypothetical protein
MTRTPRLDAVGAALGAILLGIGVGLHFAGADAPTRDAGTWLLVVGILLDTAILTTMRPVRPATEATDAAGWMEFRRELRRARRHARPLTIVRIPRPAHDPDHHASAAADIRALGLKLRLTDRWWADDESIYLMLPESDRAAALPVLDRMADAHAAARTNARMAMFPDDGLTSGALIAAVHGPTVERTPTPIRVPADMPLFVEDELALGDAQSSV